jgi:hypothetical protein
MSRRRKVATENTVPETVIPITPLETNILHLKNIKNTENTAARAKAIRITESTAQARAIREGGRENKVKATTAIPPNILPKNVTAQVEVITDPRQNEIPRRVKVLSRNIDTTRHRTILVKVLSRQSAAKPPHNLLPLEGRGTMLET